MRSQQTIRVLLFSGRILRDPSTQKHKPTQIRSSTRTVAHRISISHFPFDDHEPPPWRTPFQPCRQSTFVQRTWLPMGCKLCTELMMVCTFLLSFMCVDCYLMNVFSSSFLSQKSAWRHERMLQILLRTSMYKGKTTSYASTFNIRIHMLIVN